MPAMLHIDKLLSEYGFDSVDELVDEIDDLEAWADDIPGLIITECEPNDPERCPDCAKCGLSLDAVPPSVEHPDESAYPVCVECVTEEDYDRTDAVTCVTNRHPFET